MTFDSGELFIVAIYIWLASYVVFLTNLVELPLPSSESFVIIWSNYFMYNI